MCLCENESEQERWQLWAREGCTKLYDEPMVQNTKNMMAITMRWPNGAHEGGLGYSYILKKN